MNSKNLKQKVLKAVLFPYQKEEHMLNKITHHLTVLAAKKLLETNQSENISTAKSVISIVAGAYIFQRGIRNIIKHPVISLQETLLGAYLIHEALKSIREIYPDKPKEVSQVRKNQIQGNDPNSAVPAFV